jgi:hypothetical protein
VWGVAYMSNQHTANHNAALTFTGALQGNHLYETLVDRRNLAFDNAVIVPIPWKQIHRANVPHLARHSR